MLVRTAYNASITSEFPTAKPIREPAMLNVLESEWNSTATFIAPGTSRTLGATKPSKVISLYARSDTRTMPCRAQNATADA